MRSAGRRVRKLADEHTPSLSAAAVISGFSASILSPTGCTAPPPPPPHKMSPFISCCSLVLFLFLCSMPELAGARGGRRTGQGKGKSGLQFAQVAEFSLIQQPLTDNRSAHIVTGSHFSQVFRLGFKLRLICKARGDPRPKIKWFKEGMEMQPKRNAHYYEKPLGKDEIWSKLEIDPATMGDQGVYACVANNQHGVMAKNFKAEYR